MFEYSNTQFFEQYSSIKHWVTKMYSKSVNPTAFILGGQPGAGKTTLQKQIRNNNKNIIIINADSFREFHPYFDEIQNMYGKESPKHTQPFINQVTERLIDDLSTEKYNLIIEGTLRTANVPISSCKTLKEKGYRVELHIMAVKSQISYESTILRYENAFAQGEIPRATAKAHHDMVADAIADNLDIIEKTGTFDSIKLFNRNGDCLYPAVGCSSASEVENRTLNGWWTVNETEQLKEIVAAVTDLKAARNAEDLTAYKKHAEEVIAFAESNQYQYIKATRNQADQLRSAGISVEGDTVKNETSVIRIPPTQSEKADKILNQNPNVPKK